MSKEKVVEVEEYDLSPEDKERVAKLEDRIEELLIRQRMYTTAARSNPVASGAGYRMASQAMGEVGELRAERARILKGTQAKVDEIKEELEALKRELSETHKLNVMRKKKLKEQISKKDEELEAAKRL